MLCFLEGNNNLLSGGNTPHLSSSIHSDPLYFHDVKLLVTKLRCRCSTFKSFTFRDYTLVIVADVPCATLIPDYSQPSASFNQFCQQTHCADQLLQTYSLSVSPSHRPSLPSFAPDLFKYRLVNCKLINSTFLHNKEGCLLSDVSDDNNAYMVYFVSFLGTLAVLPGNIVSALLMDKIGRLRMLGNMSDGPHHSTTRCIEG